MKLVGQSGWISARDEEAEEALEVLHGVPGVKLRETSIELHRTHVPLLPEHLQPDLTFPHQEPEFKPPFTLREYQEEAVQFGLQRPATLLLHDLGMGKTVMALSLVKSPSLVVVPTSAVFGWQGAAESMGMRVQLLTGKYTRGFIEPADLYVVTYGSAGNWIGAFKRLGEGPRLHTLAADEIHLMHKKKLKWTQAFKGTACDQRLGLTATVIRNRMPSLWGVLDTLQPGAWGTRFEFLERYSDAYRGEYGMELGSPTHVDELSKRLTEVAVRRTWNEPGMDKYRPPLTRERIEVPIANKKRVQRLEKATRRAMERKRLEGSVLRILTEQRQETGALKAEWALSSGWAQDEASKYARTVWWCWFKEQAKALYEGAKSWDMPVDMITGESLSKKRAEVLREWEYGNRNEPRALVATQGALNFAVNLVTAQAVYFIEYDWAPVNLVQAEKRHHRPGNKHEEVFAHYLVIPGTTDDDIAEALYTKIEEEEILFGDSGSLNQVGHITKHQNVTATGNVLNELAERILKR